MDMGAFVTVATTFFFILNPFSSLSLFISVTNRLDRGSMGTYANKAVLVAAILLVVFVLIGPGLMRGFGVTMDSFSVAGGIVLFLMSMELIFGLKLTNMDDEKGAPWTIIATPILTGPGMITTAILLSDTHGMTIVLAAGILALLFTWITLRSATRIMKFIGEQTVGILSRIIGLLITAMSIELVFKGAAAWFSNHAAQIILGILTSM